MDRMASDVSTSHPASVVVIDDHDIVRFGLETLIQQCPELRFAGSAPTLREGLELIRSQQPGLVITDMGTADSSGLDTVRAVVTAQQPRATLVVSMQEELLYGEQVLALGARGYLMKESAHALAIPAALAVLHGGTWVSPRLNAKLLNRFLQRARLAPADLAHEGEMELTPREIEVLQLLKSGRTSKEIASALELSTRTVDIHRANIKRKLHLRTGAELIAYASSRL
jgi:DNA-binding NarL/FixJ family response regulator